MIITHICQTHLLSAPEKALIWSQEVGGGLRTLFQQFIACPMNR